MWHMKDRGYNLCVKGIRMILAPKRLYIYSLFAGSVAASGAKVGVSDIYA